MGPTGQDARPSQIAKLWTQMFRALANEADAERPQREMVLR
jgi:hypothetical protein